jgi:hypothetical protein
MLILYDLHLTNNEVFDRIFTIPLLNNADTFDYLLLLGMIQIDEAIGVPHEYD